MLTIPNILILILAFIATTATVIERWPKIKRWFKKRLLAKKIPQELFSQNDIERATEHYIPPHCTTIDPAQMDGKTSPKTGKKKLFKTIDEFIHKTADNPYLWLLSDSGTGKTAFVLNYFAHSRRRLHKKQQRIVLVPLGIPDTEKYINEIDARERQNIILFLDGFDEDTKAQENYSDRFTTLMDLCRGFKRVLITCRAQFFPDEKAIPRKTNIEKLGSRAAGESGYYAFSKLYIAPFIDKQIKAYFRNLYPLWRWKKRKQAFKLAKKMPELVRRPMLFASIPVLLEKGKTFHYAFQLYEVMINAWIQREDRFIPDGKALRQFSERLAVDLYTKRQGRGAERIARDELEPMAEQWKINLTEWQLSSRSLLNHDAAYYYKFAHRSIMEYLFVTRLFKNDPLTYRVERTGQMNTFLREIVKTKWPELSQNAKVDIIGLIGNLTVSEQLSSVLRKVDIIGLIGNPLQLRDKAVELSDSEVTKMLKKLDYFDSRQNKNGKGLVHLYDLHKKDGEKYIVDLRIGLTWQQSGSGKEMAFAKAQEYVQQLNTDNYGGYSDWRLPTLEEAMSLMEPEKKHGDLYIDPVFDAWQRWIWTADKNPAGRVWCVYFYRGDYINNDVIGTGFIRAVRS